LDLLQPANPLLDRRSIRLLVAAALHAQVGLGELDVKLVELGLCGLEIERLFVPDFGLGKILEFFGGRGLGQIILAPAFGGFIGEYDAQLRIGERGRARILFGGEVVFSGALVVGGFMPRWASSRMRYRVRRLSAMVFASVSHIVTARASGGGRFSRCF